MSYAVYALIVQVDVWWFDTLALTLATRLSLAYLTSEFLASLKSLSHHDGLFGDERLCSSAS